MIDCWRNEEDMYNWRRLQLSEARRRIAADPRFYNGALYTDLHSRRAAEARDRLELSLAALAHRHKTELRAGIALGSPRSAFLASGARK